MCADLAALLCLLPCSHQRSTKALPYRKARKTRDVRRLFVTTRCETFTPIRGAAVSLDAAAQVEPPVPGDWTQLFIGEINLI